VGVFRQQARSIARLPQPFLIVVSQRDRALQLSARLTGEPQRLGNLPSSEAVRDLPVTLVDVTAFSSRDGHFTVASSPALIGLLGQLGAVNLALNTAEAANSSLLPAGFRPFRRASEVVLTPDEQPRRLLPFLSSD
jgi:esterase/lipase superfamily enzyme